jgi:hypothetical protein
VTLAGLPLLLSSRLRQLTGLATRTFRTDELLWESQPTSSTMSRASSGRDCWRLSFFLFSMYLVENA